MTAPREPESKHSALPWSVGRLLNTKSVSSMSDAWKAEAARRESLMVFSGFTAEDEGRSRVNVAICSTPEHAALIVEAVNSHAAQKAAVRELCAALKFTLKELWDERHSHMSEEAFNREYADEISALAKHSKEGE